MSLLSEVPTGLSRPVRLDRGCPGLLPGLLRLVQEVDLEVEEGRHRPVDLLRQLGLDLGQPVYGPVALVVVRVLYHFEERLDGKFLLRTSGFVEHYQLLDAAGVAEKVRIAGAVAGLWSGTAAIVHPGRLVRGLAALVERMGARIVERTPVTDFRAAASESAGGSAGGMASSAPAALITPRGEIRAPVVVLAGEAYLVRLAKLHRQLVPMYSLIVLTEPIDDARWAEIGWAGREVVASARLSIDYLSRTADGRILFGGRGAPYRLGSPIRDAYDRHDPTHEMLRGFVRTWFPMLRDVRFTHAWGGPLGMPRDWHPSFAFDPRSGIASARGYVGHGVSTANLAGRTLADLITGTRSPLTELPLANHRSPNWEVEPFRWLGIRYVQGAMSRLDRGSEATGRPPTGRSLAERIASH